MSLIFHFRQCDLVYFAVPKVANTSIRSWLLPLVTDTPREKIHNIHQDVEWPRISKASYIKIAPDNLSFAIVRNPWERIVSTYQDKICREQVHGPMGQLDFTANMPFIDYLERLATFRDGQVDVHIRSQWNFITHRNRLLPDIVIDVTQLYKIPRLLHGWSGDKQFLSPIMTLNKTQNKTQKKKNIDHLVSRPNDHAFFEDMIKKRFRKEITLLGYQYPYK